MICIWLKKINESFWRKIWIYEPVPIPSDCRRSFLQLSLTGSFVGWIDIPPRLTVFCFGGGVFSFGGGASFFFSSFFSGISIYKSKIKWVYSFPWEIHSISNFESLKTNRCATCINTIFPSFNQTYNFGILNFCVALGIFLKSLWYLLLAWVATSLFGGDAFEAAFLNEFTVCPIYDFSSKSKVILYPFVMIIFRVLH